MSSPGVVKEVFDCRGVHERGAESEILLTESVEWMQRFILVLEQSAPKDMSDPFAETLGDLRALCSRIQGQLDR